MKVLTAVIILVLLFVYTILGGIIFHYIEIGNEENLISEVDQELKFFLNSKACLNYSDVVTLYQIMNQMDLGGLYLDSGGGLAQSSFRDFRSSIFAAINMQALVGSYHTMPNTTGGRAFAVVYLLIGIFLLFGTFYLTGKLTNLCLDKIWIRIQTGFCKKRNTADLLLRQLVLAIIGFILFIIFPAVGFSQLEQWSYGMSVYYCISLVFSLGFGDMPGQNHNVGLSDDFLQWYRLACGFWILLTVFWFGSILLTFDGEIRKFVIYETEKVVDVVEEEIEKNLENMENNLDGIIKIKTAVSEKETDSTAPTNGPNPAYQVTSGYRTLIQVT